MLGFALLVAGLCPMLGAAPYGDIVEIPEDRVGSVPTTLITCGGVLYFSADDGLSGRELWAMTGDEQVYRVADIALGPESSNPRKFFDADGVLYFVADSHIPRQREAQVFAVHGPGEGVRQLSKEAGGLEIIFGTTLGNRLYFSADSRQSGRELWMADSAEGTVELFHEFNPGPGHGFAAWDYQFATFGKFMYFPQFLPSYPDEASIWICSGDRESLRPVPYVGDSPPTHATARLFAGEAHDVVSINNNRGPMIWTADRESGALEPLELLEGVLEKLPMEGVVLGDRFFFRGYQQAIGVELWVADLVSREARLVKDIAPGPASGGPHKITTVGDRVFFVADDHVHGSELWVSDGTEAGTRMVVDMVPGPVRSDPYSFFPYGGGLLFSCNHNRYGEELWFTDGTAEGTRLVKDIYPRRTSSEPYYLTELRGTVYFCARSPERGYELWATDATTEGTRLVAAINPRIRMMLDASPRDLMVHEGLLYFTAARAGGGRSLWVTEGCAESTRPVAVFPGDDGEGGPTRLASGDDGLYFDWEDGSGGVKTWRLGGEGTVAEVVEARPVEESPALACLDEATFQAHFSAMPFPPEGAMVGDRFLFSAARPETGIELWSIDCQGGEPELVADILPGPGSSQPTSFFSFGNAILFQAFDVNFGAELWGSDGTKPGTRRLLDFKPTHFSGLPHHFTAWGDRVVFVCRMEGDLMGLWGIEEVTPSFDTFHMRLFQQSRRTIHSPTVFDDKLFFVSDDPATGEELFCLDSPDHFPRVVRPYRPALHFDPLEQSWWAGPSRGGG